MFCRNCGKELPGSLEFCSNCGARPVAGTSFCPGCGAPTTPMTEICTKCGVRVAGVLNEKTWMPTVAGVLTIIGGVAQLLGGLAIAIAGGFGGIFFGMPWLSAIGVPLIILGIVALAGGIYALKRQMWGLALAGSICVIVAGNFVFGILSLIFVIIGKKEFE